MTRRPRVRAAGRAWAGWAMLFVLTTSALAWTAGPAAAHVLPSSSVRLAVHQDRVVATVTIPVPDLATATGLDLGDETQAAVDAQRAAIGDYLTARVRPTGADGRAWSVAVGSFAVDRTGDPATTGRYQQLVTDLTLTPPADTDVRAFDLGYTAIVDRIATHTVIVLVASDHARPDLAAYQLGVIRRDTVTNTTTGLTVDLGASERHTGFGDMVVHGMQHIADGTDHQLFLLTLLLPAPLLAVAGRWSGPAPIRSAVRRITAITLAFTVGHSVTLALGALGVPSPQGVVEALIAVSILVAAGHAIRPVFPGREAAVAAAFGLIHGLAFSETLRELDLAGGELVGALLGFNLGIELMQLIVVALVLPPLIVLARSGRYRGLRLAAAVITAVAALGWLGDRLGQPNPVAGVADQLGTIAVPVVGVLWAVALAIGRRSRRERTAQPG